MNRRPDSELAADLHRIALELQEPPSDLADAVMRLLANGGRASGKQMAQILRRRIGDVLAACQQLARDGRITRVGQKWVAR